jgi:opacity protein-like surface antigen
MGTLVADVPQPLFLPDSGLIAFFQRFKLRAYRYSGKTTMRRILKLTGSLSAASLLGVNSVIMDAHAQGIEAYIGGHAGALFGEGEISGALGGPSTDDTFFNGGILAGILYRNGEAFYGAEADFGIAGGDDLLAFSPCNFGAQICEFNWNAHMRLRGGRSFGNTDVFAAIGLAIANLDIGLFGDETLYGVSLGGGADFETSGNWNFRVEALADIYSDRDLDANYTVGWSDVTVRGAAIYKFPVN